MSVSRSHSFSALLGGLGVAMVMAVLPAVAANGDLDAFFANHQATANRVWLNT